MNLAHARGVCSVQMRRIQGKRAGLLAVAAGMAAWVALGATAFASNHLIKIREVYAGSTTHPSDEYVELQMYAPGQNLFHLGTETLFYNSTGSLTNTFLTNGSVHSSDPPNSASQQRVLLISPGAESTFGLTAGYELPNATTIDNAGGAVCYVPSTIGFEDCVSWGNFDNTSGTPLPSSTGGNADSGGIPDGSAIARSIAHGCPTLLEASDDTNKPADWSNVTPNPLKNSDTPPEHPCANTTITKAPKAKTTDRTPTFKFSSTVTPATFKCKIDSKSFRTCPSPFTSKKLSLGKHTFKARATANGFTDPTPASAKFKVVKKKHHR